MDVTVLHLPVLCMVIVAASAHQAQYQLQQSLGFGPEVATLSGHSLETAESVMVCARHCTQLEMCTNFIWDSSLHTCTFGSVLSQNQSVPTTFSLGHLDIVFLRVKVCWAELGYGIRSYGATSLCIQWMGEKKNLDQAKRACSGVKGALVKANTLEKIRIVSELAMEHIVTLIAGDDDVGIGLDDEITEDVYRWSDGSVMTQEERTLFLEGEPNGGTKENWITIWLFQPGLNDFPSTLPTYFVCELS